MNLLVAFSYAISLQNWYDTGIIFREVLLYKKLMENHAQITFLTYGSNRDLKFSKILGNIKVIPCLDLIKSKIPHFSIIKTLWMPIKLNNVIRDFDLIKTNQLEGSWIAWISKLLYRKKIIIRGGFEWLNRHIMLFNKKGIKNQLKYLIYYILIYLNEFIAYKLADGIILSSDLDISFIIKHFKLKNKYKNNRIRRFYNYIDVDLFKPLNISKKEKSVLFIGRLTFQKNLFALLNAFRDLKDFSLDIIGQGPLEKELIQRSKELNININLLGYFPNHKIPEIINQYEIFILPSHWEGNPKVLLEAMSCGIACIGANSWGIKNIIKHNENGYLCDVNPKSIKKAILTLYNDKNLREKFGKNARKFILKECSLNSIVQKEYLFYLDILKR